MLALAIAAGCKPAQLVAHCKKMEEVPKDTYVKRERAIPHKQIEDIKSDMKKALVDYGLVPVEALGILDELFTE